MSCVLKSLVLGSSSLLEEESGSVGKKLLIIDRSLIQVHSGFAAHATLDLFISCICSLVIYEVPWTLERIKWLPLWHSRCHPQCDWSPLLVLSQGCEEHETFFSSVTHFEVYLLQVSGPYLHCSLPGIKYIVLEKNLV